MKPYGEQPAAQRTLERTGKQQRDPDVGQGAAQLALEPTLEESAQFRTYDRARLI
jgi:hypothetical protein